MLIMGLDPSSSSTGYALIDSLDRDGLREGGLLVPSTAHIAIEELPKFIREHIDAKELTAYRRIHSMAAELYGILEEFNPDLVAVEIPSGKCGTGSRRGASGSLTTYGLAAGMLTQICNAWHIEGVLPVTERQWTAGQGSKETRQRKLTAFYAGTYTRETDLGADVADAIGLARWTMANYHEFVRQHSISKEYA